MYGTLCSVSGHSGELGAIIYSGVTKMENLTKKINLIDILGMILPGGLTLMLFEKDIGFLRFMTWSIGSEPSVVIWSASFLLGSYFVGMLLHELGSIAEKLVWLNPLTDPRVYGAVRSGLIENYQGKATGGKTLHYGMRAVVQTFPMALLYLAAGCTDVGSFLLAATLYIVAAVAIQWPYYHQLFELIGKGGFCQKCESLFHLEKTHHKIGILDGESARKVEVFSGFRTLARSILAMLAVAQWYVVMSQGNQSSYLVQLHERVCVDPPLLFLRRIIVLLLVIRYWHFSCLRYEYRYNAYNKEKQHGHSEE